MFSYRQHVIDQNLAFIQKENANNHTYTLGITQFIFMTHQEFVEAVELKGYRIDDKSSVRSSLHPACSNDQSVLQSIDWRKKKIFSPIQNQGTCGSCYAIATAELTNALYGITGTKLSGLSAQQLVDCSQSYGNSGCNGGTTSASMRYIKDVGLVTEQAYPYVGKLQPCKNAINQRYTVGNFSKYSAISESAIQSFVEKSPVVAAIYSTWPPLQVCTCSCKTGREMQQVSSIALS